MEPEAPALKARFTSDLSGLISMNVMSGTEASGAIDPRFERLFLETDFSLGALPRL